MLPYLQNCSIIWASTYSSHLLFHLQKKAIRIITHSPPRTHTYPLFSRLKILNIINIYKHQICSFIFPPHAVWSPLFMSARLPLLVISPSPVPYLCPLDPRAPHYFTLSSPLFVSARLPRSSLFHSLQSLICVRSTPALLIISLSPVPYLCPLDSRAPHYFTLSSPLFVSARPPRSSLFHSLQSLICLPSTPNFTLFHSPYVSPFERERGLYGEGNSTHQQYTNSVVRVCVFVELRGYQRGRLSGGGGGGGGGEGLLNFFLSNWV